MEIMDENFDEDDFESWYDRLCFLLIDWPRSPDRDIAYIDFERGISPEESAEEFEDGDFDPNIFEEEV